MKNRPFVSVLAGVLTGLAMSFGLLLSCASAQNDPLPSWNDAAAKRAIIDFVGRVVRISSRSRQCSRGT